MRYFLGVDLGGTVIKAGLYRAEGDEVAVSESYPAVLTDQPGFSERNMDILWQDVCAAIKKVLADAGITANQIRGVSFSSHGKGLYAIDQQGKPVRNGIISSDTRATDLVSQCQQQGIEKSTYPRSLQPLWSSHPAILLRWLKTHETAAYDKIDRIFMVHDYIRFRLTGEMGAEITNISGSGLFNQHTGDYDAELMRQFDLAEVQDKTAPLVGSAELAGYVTHSAATDCGLLAGTAVYGGLFDVVGAALCSGVVDEHILSTVAGTWSIATSVTKNLVVNDYPYAWARYCIDDHYFVHEGSPTSAGNLAWFVRHFCQDDPTIYQQLNQAVAERSHRPCDIVFLPYLYGSNLSLNLSSALVGLRGHHTMGDIAHAIYQGIVFSHLIHQDRILQLNPHAQRIRMTGGPSQSAVWMQMFADAGNLPLDVVEIQQSGCQAAALCAAVGAGAYRDFSEATHAVQPKIARYLPNPAAHQRLRAQMAHYLAVANALSEVKQ